MILHESQEHPSLGDLNYKAHRFLETDSKMSDILLVSDRRQRPLILKIARVDQRARADVNREAIKNTVNWLQALQPYRGLITMHALERKGMSPLRAWFGQPAYYTVLHQWPGTPECLVMEYISGGSLSEFVGNKRLSVNLALWIVHYIARTLAYIHRHGCVHRDLKPENILFHVFPDSVNNPKAIPILIDFGVAARAGEEKFVSGSRLWMAPELQEAYELRPLPVDPAWDVYALGLILCYLLTGRRPRRKNYEYQSYDLFREETIALLERDADKGTPTARAARTHLQELITRALDQRPENRPTAQEFAAETATLLADMGTPLPRRELLRMHLEQSDLLPTLSRHQPKLVGAACVALLLLLVLFFPALRRALPASWTVAAREPQTVYAVAAQQTLPAVVDVVDSPPPTTTSTPPATANDQVASLTVISLPPAASTPAATQPPPTLAPWSQTASEDTPTLARSMRTTGEPPTLAALTFAIDEPAPTLAPLTPTPTPSPPTRTPRPTATARPSATAALSVTGPLGNVQLLLPATETSSSQPRVEFSWQISGQALAADHCFELVFWDPQKSADKRSPVGAGKSTRTSVNFAVLANSSDPLLSNLAQSKRPFHWGVRLVSCASPQQIIRDVAEARAYTYEGE